MGEGMKIVTEHFPVERLPEELRRGWGRETVVRVTVESEQAGVPNRRPLTSFVGAAKGVYATPEEAVAAIRALRDEWE